MQRSGDFCVGLIRALCFFLLATAAKITTVFNQGDEGRSWYILLKGSVDVVIHGKGTVATLKEGDDFGKLALINDAPRYVNLVTVYMCMYACACFCKCVQHNSDSFFHSLSQSIFLRLATSIRPCANCNH